MARTDSTASEVVWTYPLKRLAFLVDGKWLNLQDVPADVVSVVLEASFNKVPVAVTYDSDTGTIENLGVRVTP